MILIQISAITINPGRREAAPEHIQEMAKSMAEVGLLQPIVVDQQYTLIAGLHRLEAAKMLAWTEIECTVSDLDGLQAEIAEIDENIIRLNLHYSDEGKQLARRKEIYEMLHPETRQGHRNGQTSKTDTETVLGTKSFADDTAEKTRQSPRTIRRKIQVATNLTPEVTEIAKNEGITFKNALKLSHLKPEKQMEAAELLASGKIRSVDEYTEAQSEAEQSGAELDAPPFRIGGKKFATFAEGVADLKNPDKDCSCTPDDFLAEVTAFVRKFHQEIEWYNNPYYEEVFPALSPEQLDYLRGQMESISAAADQLYNNVERTIKK